MTPDLSRRLARALHALPADALTFEQRIDLAVEAEQHDSFDDLPEWIREVVERGERERP